MNGYQIDRDQLATTLNEVLKNISEHKNPIELDAYRREFKKHISIFKRGYVTAYLLQHYINRPKKHSPNPEMKSVFISIGRDRRIFPRDIIGTIIEKTDINRHEIGHITILDTYTFVEVNKNKTDIVILKLNGVEYRGKTLTVNYAKERNPI